MPFAVYFSSNLDYDNTSTLRQTCYRASRTTESYIFNDGGFSLIMVNPLYLHYFCFLYSSVPPQTPLPFRNALLFFLYSLDIHITRLYHHAGAVVSPHRTLLNIESHPSHWPFPSRTVLLSCINSPMHARMFIGLHNVHQHVHI